MKRLSTVSFVFLFVLLCACEPHGQHTGIVLGGTETPLPADWRFTDADKEIEIQVHTPYLIPHAVTIWCAEVNGQLYVASSAPQTKHWPAWVDRDPNVHLRIGDKAYAVRLVPLEDAGTIASVQAAYAAKYQLKAKAGGTMGDARYWHVTARPNPA